jgi:hypothetical protein
MKPLPRALRHLGVTIGIWVGFRVLVVTAPEFYSDTVVIRSARGERFANVSASVPVLLTRTARRNELGFKPRSKREATRNISLLENAMSKLPNFDRDWVTTPVLQDARRIESEKPLAEHPAAPNANPSVPTSAIPVPARIDPWSLSAWAIYRPNSGPVSLSPRGELGGSQFGFRAQRRIFQPTQNLTLSLNLRGSTPLKISNGKEAGLGLAIRRAGRVPVELIAERRVAFDRGGRNAFAGLVAAGFNDLPAVAGFNLNGYAQAGIVGFQRRDGFVDGSLRLERKIVSSGSLGVELGGGLWGAAQPGVSRVDIGPSAAVRFRIGNAAMRLGTEWRQRISGDARPGSGPAITFGLDY